MASYLGNDRRQPLSGISKQTFVDNAIAVFGEKAIGFASMWYDMQRCTDSKVQLVHDKVDNELVAKMEAINGKCAECVQENDEKYIQKADIRGKKYPFSMFSFIVFLCLLFLAIGAGVLEVSDVIDLRRFIKP